MKAILVIDIPDKLDYLHLYLEGRILYTTEEDIGFKYLKELSLCVLKPMPRKNQGKFWHNSIGKENTYVCGWNACVDEILGEQDELNS